MVFEKIVLNGLIYSIIGSGYLLLFMITFNPRIWGYQDYPDRVKEKIPPQTRSERILAGLIGLPWLLFILAYPVISTISLKTELDGVLSFEIAFFHIFFMVFLFFMIDLIVLDWFIISKITPEFVIIAGTTPEDYKDFSHHYKGHFIASIPLTIICIIFAALIVYF